VRGGENFHSYISVFVVQKYLLKELLKGNVEYSQLYRDSFFVTENDSLGKNMGIIHSKSKQQSIKTQVQIILFFFV